jgi:two-component system, chemotaxis family, chemotaxis protein CheY
MRALVVDDLLIARRLIVTNLKTMGFKEIFEADDGARALQVVNQQEESFDLIVTDWLMPNMDGLEFVREIRVDGEMKNTPILMVTSVDEKDDVLRAIQAGVNDYISKPFTPETLRKKIEWLLKTSNDYLLK